MEILALRSITEHRKTNKIVRSNFICGCFEDAKDVQLGELPANAFDVASETPVGQVS